MAFLADEVGIALADLGAEAAAVAAACRYQRMALQMVGDFINPISKKNKKLSWGECLALIEEQKATIPGVTQVAAMPKKMNFVLIVIGIDGAGKTTLLNSLQGKGSSKTVPSCGFSSISMQLEENTKVTFYDLGGQKKIRSNWAHYYHDVHGIIYVMDGADSER